MITYLGCWHIMCDVTIVSKEKKKVTRTTHYLTEKPTSVKRQNGKRSLESGFGSAGYANGF